MGLRPRTIDGVSPLETITYGTPIEERVPGDIYQDWDHMVRSGILLGKAVNALCASTGRRFDRIAGIARGGLFTGNVLSRVLGFDSSLAYYNMSIKSYGRKDPVTGAMIRDRIETGQMPTPEEVNGHRWILADEVWDSGHTGKFGSEYLYKHGALDVLTVTDNVKIDAALDPVYGSGVLPDLSITMTEPIWVHFAWEELEAMGEEAIVTDTETLGQVIELPAHWYVELEPMQEAS